MSVAPVRPKDDDASWFAEDEPEDEPPAVSLFEEAEPEQAPAVKPAASSWLDHLDGTDDAGDLDWGDDAASGMGQPEAKPAPIADEDPWGAERNGEEPTATDEPEASAADDGFWGNAPEAPASSQEDADPVSAHDDDFWGAPESGEGENAPQDESSSQKAADPASAADDGFWGAAPAPVEKTPRQNAAPDDDDFWGAASDAGEDAPAPAVGRTERKAGSGANEEPEPADDFWGASAPDGENGPEETPPAPAPALDDGSQGISEAGEERRVEPASSDDGFWGPSAPSSKTDNAKPSSDASGGDFWGDASEAAPSASEPPANAAETDGESTQIMPGPQPPKAHPSNEGDDGFWGDAAQERARAVPPPAKRARSEEDGRESASDGTPAVVSSSRPGFFDGPSLPVHLDLAESDDEEGDASESSAGAGDPWDDAPARPAAAASAPFGVEDEDDVSEHEAKRSSPLADIPFRLIAIVLAAVLVLGAGGFGVATWMRHRAAERTKAENAALCSQLSDARALWKSKTAQVKGLHAQPPAAPSFACSSTGNAMRESLGRIAAADKRLDSAIAKAVQGAWKPTADGLAGLKAKRPGVSADTIDAALTLSKQSPRTAADLQSMQRQAKALDDKAASEQKAADAKKAAAKAKADAEAKRKADEAAKKAADEAAKKAAEDAANAPQPQYAPAYTPTYVPRYAPRYVPPAPAPKPTAPAPPAPAPAPKPAPPKGNSDASM
jgi:hypothetical protein